MPNLRNQGKRLQLKSMLASPEQLSTKSAKKVTKPEVLGFQEWCDKVWAVQCTRVTDRALDPWLQKRKPEMLADDSPVKLWLKELYDHYKKHQTYYLYPNADQELFGLPKIANFFMAIAALNRVSRTMCDIPVTELLAEETLKSFMFKFPDALYTIASNYLLSDKGPFSTEDIQNIKDKYITVPPYIPPTELYRNLFNFFSNEEGAKLYIDIRPVGEGYNNFHLVTKKLYLIAKIISILPSEISGLGWQQGLRITDFYVRDQEDPSKWKLKEDIIAQIAKSEKDYTQKVNPELTLRKLNSFTETLATIATDIPQISERVTAIKEKANSENSVKEQPKEVVVNPKQPINSRRRPGGR